MPRVYPDVLRQVIAELDANVAREKIRTAQTHGKYAGQMQSGSGQYGGTSKSTSKKNKGSFDSFKDVLGRLGGTALSTLDVPRAFVFSAVHEGLQAIGEADKDVRGNKDTASFGDIFRQTFDEDERIYGSDILKSFNAPEKKITVLGRELAIGGFALDVLADPLTYVGAGVATKSVQGSRQAAEAIARGALREVEEKALTGAARAKVLSEAGDVSARAARRGIAAATDDQLKRWVPQAIHKTKGGDEVIQRGLYFRVPGGKGSVPVLPKPIREAIHYKVAAPLKGSVSHVGDIVKAHGNRFAGAYPELERAIRAGRGEEIISQIAFKDARQYLTSASSALAREYVDEFGGLVKPLDEGQRTALREVLTGNDEAANLLPAGVAEKARAWFDKIYDDLSEQGIVTPRSQAKAGQSYINDYVPHLLTDEAKAVLGIRGQGRAGVREFFENMRKLRADGTPQSFLDETFSATTPAELRTKVDEIFKRKAGQLAADKPELLDTIRDVTDLAFYQDDIIELATQYAMRAAHRVEYARQARRLAGLGFGEIGQLGEVLTTKGRSALRKLLRKARAVDFGFMTTADKRSGLVDRKMVLAQGVLEARLTDLETKLDDLRRLVSDPQERAALDALEERMQASLARKVQAEKKFASNAQVRAARAVRSDEQAASLADQISDLHGLLDEYDTQIGQLETGVKLRAHQADTSERTARLAAQRFGAAEATPEAVAARAADLKDKAARRLGMDSLDDLVGDIEKELGQVQAEIERLARIETPVGSEETAARLFYAQDAFEANPTPEGRAYVEQLQEIVNSQRSRLAATDSRRAGRIAELQAQADNLIARRDALVNSTAGQRRAAEKAVREAAENQARVAAEVERDARVLGEIERDWDRLSNESARYLGAEESAYVDELAAQVSDLDMQIAQRAEALSARDVARDAELRQLVEQRAKLKQQTISEHLLRKRVQADLSDAGAAVREERAKLDRLLHYKFITSEERAQLEAMGKLRDAVVRYKKAQDVASGMGRSPLLGQQLAELDDQIRAYRELAQVPLDDPALLGLIEQRQALQIQLDQEAARYRNMTDEQVFQEASAIDYATQEMGAGTGLIPPTGPGYPRTPVAEPYARAGDDAVYAAQARGGGISEQDELALRQQAADQAAQDRIVAQPPKQKLAPGEYSLDDARADFLKLQERVEGTFAGTAKANVQRIRDPQEQAEWLRRSRLKNERSRRSPITSERVELRTRGGYVGEEAALFESPFVIGGAGRGQAVKEIQDQLDLINRRYKLKGTPGELKLESLSTTPQVTVGGKRIRGKVYQIVGDPTEGVFEGRRLTGEVVEQQATEIGESIEAAARRGEQNALGAPSGKWVRSMADTVLADEIQSGKRMELFADHLRAAGIDPNSATAQGWWKSFREAKGALNLGPLRERAAARMQARLWQADSALAAAEQGVPKGIRGTAEDFKRAADLADKKADNVIDKLSYAELQRASVEEAERHLAQKVAERGAAATKLIDAERALARKRAGAPSRGTRVGTRPTPAEVNALDSYHRAADLHRRVQARATVSTEGHLQEIQRLQTEIDDAKQLLDRSYSLRPDDVEAVESYIGALQESAGWRQLQIDGRAGGDEALTQWAALNGEIAELDAKLATNKTQRLTIETEIGKLPRETKMLFGESVRGEMRQVLPGVKLNPEAADVLSRITRVTQPQHMEGLFRKYDALVRYIKQWQIATPGFHARNFFGGVFNNELDEVALSSYTQFWRARRHYMQGLKTPEAAKYAAIRKAVGIGQIGIEARDIDYVLQHPSLNPFNKEFFWLKRSRELGGHVEELLRGAMAWDTVYRKMGALSGEAVDDTMRQEALSRVLKFHFDYDDLSQAEQNIRHYAVPFYTWTRKNIPLQFEMMLHRPRMYARYWQAKQEIEHQSEPDGFVPSWFGENLAIRLPLEVGGGHVYAMPDLPLREIPRTFEGIADPLRFAATNVTPVLKLPVELAMDKQFFKGLPLSEDRVVPLPRVLRPFQEVFDSLGLSEGGLISEKNAYALEQLVPIYGRERRLFPSEKKYDEKVWSSVASFLGFGSRTLTKDEQERYQRGENIRAGVEAARLKREKKAREG